MSEERRVLFTRAGGRTKCAVLEDGSLVGYRDETDEGSVTGNIYLGRVENVTDSRKAAFVNIGLDKNAFLPLDGTDVPSRGQVFPVQVKSEENGSKGVRVTRDLKVVGTLLVVMPGTRHIAVSRSAGTDEERKALRERVEQALPEREMGMIVRSGALNADTDDIAREYGQLEKLCRDFLRTGAMRPAPCLLYEAGGTVDEVARSYANDTGTFFVTDDRGIYDRICAIAGGEKSELDTRSSDLFMAYNVPSQARRLLARKVNLKCGGYIVVDFTEALTVIDVNSGTFTGDIRRVNDEAALECARQLRLRDIGGIVIIDFIDMAHAQDREELLRKMDELLRRDRGHAMLMGMTRTGLVELTRRRTRSVGPHTTEETA